MNYIALDQYSKEHIIGISDLSGIDGIIVGDLYCNKRMFEYGEHELIDIVRKAREYDLMCIYQTPRYLTERNFSREMQLILYLYKENLIQKVIVQDIGAASYICKKCYGLSIVWGYMGISRNGAENLLGYSFLKEHGITEIETDKVSYIPYLLELGFEIMLMREHIKYKTVNRECYYMYENEIYDGNCNRECLTKKYSLINNKCGFDFSVDGYMLGKQYKPLELQEISTCVYNDTVTRAVSLSGYLI